MIQNFTLDSKSVESDSNPKLPKKLWLFIGHFLKPYRSMVVLYVGLALLAGFWGPFNSMLIKSMINDLSVPHSSGCLVWSAALLVLNFLIFDNFIWRSIAYINYKFQPLIKNKIISETFKYILFSSNQFFQNNLSGRISNQINSLADNVERILHNLSPDFLRGISMLIIAFASMYYVNPRFFIILAIWLAVFATFSIGMARRLVGLSNVHSDSESMYTGQVVDTIANASNVRIFSRLIYEVFRLEKYLQVTKNRFQEKEIFLILLQIGQGFLIAVMLGFMMYSLISLYEKSLITIGDFALIIGLGMEVGHVTWHTMWQVSEFYDAVGKCKQSLDNLIVPHQIIDNKDAKSLLIKNGQIDFANVKFHYSGATPLFQDKSITIKPGQKVGLVGYSGSGKSTFVNLILRIYDVTDGRILIDGQDIRDVTQDSLRRNIAMIPQDPSLFHRSLMENIRYGRIEATDEEVTDAAKKAHADDFICKLPQAYESLVGERGIKLSGGQRQRISIARAILKNAPILILDEATSQLDSVTEIMIQQSLWHLMRDKTTLIIAHRLSTLLNMDRILVFDKGRVVEDGSHADLIIRGGLYKTLWETQVGGFLPDKKYEYA
ncbi:MAG: ABC transporter ATP-binding protein [Pseudomonadota bacterium]